MRVIIQSNSDKCSVWAANYIVYKINAFRPTAQKPFVLGLPTGSTPLIIYKRLIELNKQGKVSFENVVTFNMDEYIGLDAKHKQSYAHFMFENFFNHIDIKKTNINLLDGMTKDYVKECENYEMRIKKYGKINLFLGGVGSDGHIAFNEPGSSLSSRTRVKVLAPETIKANSRFFGNDITKVPTKALTVGVGTLMEAEEVMIVATGKTKAKAVAKAIEAGINHLWPITMLQMHQHAILVCDDDASKAMKSENVKYFKGLEKKSY